MRNNLVNIINDRINTILNSASQNPEMKSLIESTLDGLMNEYDEPRIISVYIKQDDEDDIPVGQEFIVPNENNLNENNIEPWSDEFKFEDPEHGTLICVICVFLDKESNC